MVAGFRRYAPFFSEPVLRLSAAHETARGFVIERKTNSGIEHPISRFLQQRKEKSRGNTIFLFLFERLKIRIQPPPFSALLFLEHGHRARLSSPSWICLTDNTRDILDRSNNGQASGDNAHSPARNNFHHNFGRDNRVHNTGRGLQSLRLGIHFDCHRLRRRSH
jgi:hypothetical protein